MNVTPRASAAIGRPTDRFALPSVDPSGLMVPVVAVGAVLLLAGGLVFMANPKIGLAALGLPALPLMVMYPEYALLMFVAAMPFDAVAGLVADRTLSLTRLLGVGVIGAWAVWVLVNRVRIRLTTPGLLLGAYVGIAALSYFWAERPDAAWAQSQRLVQLFLLYVLTANLMTNLATLERTLNVLILATGVLGLLVLWQLPGGGGAALERGTFTYGDQSFNPNYLAAALVLPGVAAAALGRARGAFGWWRPLILVPIGAGIIVSGSRGGVVGFVAGLAVLLLARPRLAVRAVGALVLIAMVAWMVVPASVTDSLSARFLNVGSDRLSGRLDIWNVAFVMISDRPLLGVGLAGFKDAFYGYMDAANIDPIWAMRHPNGGRVAHNVYISTFAELGIFGIGTMLAAFAAHGLGALRTWRVHRVYGDPRVAAIALALCCSLASFLVFGNSIDFMMRKTQWVLLGMIQGLILATGRPGREAVR